MSKRYINLPATNQKVSLGNYIKGIKLAKAHPQETFKSGLTCWWPCAGKEIMKQFINSIHDRINQKESYLLRGTK